MDKFFEEVLATGTKLLVGNVFNYSYGKLKHPVKFYSDTYCYYGFVFTVNIDGKKYCSITPFDHDILNDVLDADDFYGYLDFVCNTVIKQYKATFK